MVTILNASRARRGSIRSLADEDNPGVHEDDGDEHFVTDAIPESCIIHKRDVSNTALRRSPPAHEQARVVRTGANRRVGRAYHDREDMHNPSIQAVASDKLSRALRTAPDHACVQADPKPGFHWHIWIKPLSSRSRRLRRLSATGPGADAAWAVAPTSVRARHLSRMGPARLVFRACVGTCVHCL